MSSLYAKVWKRWTVFLLTLSMVFTMTSFTTLEAKAAGGNGTAEDPYQITTEEELKGITGSSYYKLMNDITLTESWTPISSFRGTLDGNGKTVSGLNVNDSSNSVIGFIRNLYGEVKNLTVSGTVVSGYNGNAGRVGGIVGVNNGTMNGCNFYGSVSQIQGDNHTVAGIAGYNDDNGIIRGCSNYGDITGISTGGTYGAVFVGGITGSNHGIVEISNCANHGTIAGGVQNDNTYMGEIWGSPTWESSGAYVGGIAGDTQNANAPGCTNDGTIMGENTTVPTVLQSIQDPEGLTLTTPVLSEELQTMLSYDVTLDTRKTFARLAFSLNSFA